MRKNKTEIISSYFPFCKWVCYQIIINFPPSGIIFVFCSPTLAQINDTIFKQILVFSFISCWPEKSQIFTLFNWNSIFLISKLFNIFFLHVPFLFDQYNKINQFIFIRSNKQSEIIKRESGIILTLFIWLCSKSWYVLFAYSIVISNFIFDFLSHLILLYRLEDFGIVGWNNNPFHVKFPPGF